MDVTRWLARALPSIALVALVAFALPVSQLPTLSVAHRCCCPDPDHCKCPGDHPPAGKLPIASACHHTVSYAAAPTLPSFSSPPARALAAPAARIAQVAHRLPAPIDEWTPRRPDAPS